MIIKLKSWSKIILEIPKKIWIPGLIILLIAIFFGLRSTNGEQLKYEIVKQSSIKSSISASGVLTGKDKASLKFISGGKLAFSKYNIGESVTKGSSLAGLDTEQLGLALQQAEADLRTKQASAEKALDDVKGHSADETYIQKETRTRAEAARDAAVSNVAAARAALKQAILISPINGTVTESNFYLGQFVTASDTIIKVVDWSTIYFDTEIDESDIALITKGQKSSVNLNAYPDIELEGTIEEIIPQTKTTSSGSTVIKVRIKLSTPNIILVDGLNGDASITISEHQNTLILARDALREDNKVLVLKDSKIEEREVKLGLENDEEVEVVEGLEEGDTVVTNPSAYKPPKRFGIFPVK